MHEVYDAHLKIQWGGFHGSVGPQRATNTTEEWSLFGMVLVGSFLEARSSDLKSENSLVCVCVCVLCF